MFEITWHSEDSNTLRARVNSREALGTLRNLISSDPNLVVSSVTELDPHGVPKVRTPQRGYRPLEIKVASLVAVAKPNACAVGVGPSLCSRFPQCGHTVAA